MKILWYEMAWAFGGGAFFIDSKAHHNQLLLLTISCLIAIGMHTLSGRKIE